MRDVSVRAVAQQARFRRSHALGITALALIITSSGGAGNAAANSYAHDAGRGAVAHHAESPNVATLATESLLSSCLPGSWLHAWEEDTLDLDVYRPADYPFGPSRGRGGYEFLADGELMYHGFGPTDGPITSAGTWEWTAPDQIHISVNDPRGAYIDETLRIVSCDADVLQMERVAEADVSRRSMDRWFSATGTRHTDAS